MKKGKNFPKRQNPPSIIPSDPLLASYIKEIQHYRVLTKEEEKELAIKYYETADRKALHQLVASNLRFVVKIAFEYVHYRIRLLDLIQEGNMGLVKAVKEFNPYKNVRLTTYAVWWIRSYIQDAILKNYSLVKIGTTQAQKRLFYRLRKEQEKLEKMGIMPAERLELLASNLDAKKEEVSEMEQRISGSDISLDAPTVSHETLTPMGRLADDKPLVDETLADSEQLELFKNILNEFAKTLEGREKVIFEERLISEHPITLQEIGDRYNVSKERARQLEEQLRKKLTQYVKANYPDFNILQNSS